jgi:crossover junction endodeoxyribonuclease RusA
MQISLTLPWPPSVNHYWGQSGNRRFIGKKGVQFRKDVIEAVYNAGVTSLDGRLCVHVNLYPPDKRKRDIDNSMKSLFDACEHAGCYENDSQIDELHIIRKEVVKGGLCNIVIIQL